MTVRWDQPIATAKELMRRASAETREHVLRVARDLCYWKGIRATGVDTVASAAGVAPTTLYRLFASKDALVAAYLEREAAGYREWFGPRSPRPRRAPATASSHCSTR